MNHITINTQLKAFNEGTILDSDGRSTECYNFYDWFCNDASLLNRSKSLFGKLKKIIPLLQNIDIDKNYSFFKNNCPVSGPLYDDFRICDIESGNVIYTIVPKCGHTGNAEIWGRANDFRGPIRSAKTWNELIQDLKNNPL